MDIFVIHRGADAAAAKAFLAEVSRLAGVTVSPIVLAASSGDSWKARAEDGIYRSEAVFIYDAINCFDSENAKWEKSIAESLGRPVLEHQLGTSEAEIAERLKVIYHFEEEFDSCFQVEPKKVETL